MGQQIATRTYEDAVAWLKDHGFDILEAPGIQNRVFIKKNNCSAAIEATADGGVKIFAYPGFLIGGEIAKLINKGYQQFLKTTKTRSRLRPITSRRFTSSPEELKEALGATSLYNESLGTVSEEYNYDRVKDRTEPTPDRPKRPWETKAAAKKAARTKQRA